MSYTESWVTNILTFIYNTYLQINHINYPATVVLSITDTTNLCSHDSEFVYLSFVPENLSHITANAWGDYNITYRKFMSVQLRDIR